MERVHNSRGKKMIGRRLVLTAFSAAALASGVADARIRTGRAFVPGPEEGGAVVGQNNNPGGSCSLDEPCSGDDAGMCCSRHGYCGTTVDYCGEGCVSGAGDCWDDYDYNPGGWCSASNPCRGRFEGQCCSMYNYCGTTAEYCGRGCRVGAGRCDYDGEVHVEEGSGVADPGTALDGLIRSS